ncbi:MAG: HEAT repeat domain-containing protein [Acidobacteriota bacterium]
MRTTLGTVILLICLAPCALALQSQTGTAQLDEGLSKVASYEYGQDFKPLAEVMGLVRATKGNPELLPKVEERFVAFLKGKATLEGRKFVCEQLSAIGTKTSVPVLAELLVDPPTSDMARYALERISGPEAAEALRAALSKVGGKERIGVINSLGEKCDSPAVALLVPFATNADEPTALAAVNALGRVGDAASLKTLADLRKSATGPIRQAVLDAVVRCLDQMASRGDKAEALAGYRELYTSAEAPIIRLAALRGIAVLEGPKATQTLAEAVEKGDESVRAAAIGLLAAIPSSEATALLTGAYPKLPPRGRVQLLTALVTRGDSAAVPLLVDALKDEAVEVRLAGLEGLGKLGDSSHVMQLARIAADSPDLERAAARLSLYRLKADGVDKIVLDNLNSTPAKVKLELIRATGERRIESATDVLLKAAGDSDANVRRESRRALRETAQTQHLPALLKLLDEAKSAPERADLETAVVATLKRYDMAGLESVTSAIGKAKNVDTKASLLIVMGRAGDPSGLSLLRAALKADEPAVQRAAILGLTEWPTPEPLPDLLDAARANQVRSHQILALRGYFRLVGLRSRRSRTESVRLLEEGLKLAQQDEEKKIVLSMLPRFASPEALKLAESLKESSVSAEAKLAIERIKRSIK